MPEITAIITCVDYDDMLSLCLPRNARHFEGLYVVSAPEDARTAAVVGREPKAKLFRTGAFHAGGAPFNKGAALDDAIAAIKPAGWVCLLDADILLPADLDLSRLTFGNLYSPYRRMLACPESWHWRDDGWGQLPEGIERANGEFAGYCQIFHAADPALPAPPWHGYPWRGRKWDKTAQGCDTVFHSHWPAEKKIRPTWEVLHLGEPKINWRGRVSPRIQGRV